MSGQRDDGRFELTATRATYWHRDRGPKCCRSLADIARTHLVPAGFSWEFGRGGRFIIVSGPGLADEDTGPLYEAVSGRESF